jgi:hypothetical protein
MSISGMIPVTSFKKNIVQNPLQGPNENEIEHSKKKASFAQSAKYIEVGNHFGNNQATNPVDNQLPNTTHQNPEKSKIVLEAQQKNLEKIMKMVHKTEQKKIQGAMPLLTDLFGEPSKPGQI